MADEQWPPNGPLTASASPHAQLTARPSPPLGAGTIKCNFRGVTTKDKQNTAEILAASQTDRPGSRCPPVEPKTRGDKQKPREGEMFPPRVLLSPFLSWAEGSLQNYQLRFAMENGINGDKSKEAPIRDRMCKSKSPSVHGKFKQMSDASFHSMLQPSASLVIHLGLLPLSHEWQSTPT